MSRCLFARRRQLLPARLLLVVIALSGCATLTMSQLDVDGLPPRAELDAVTFFPQLDYQCGPAALAAVLIHAKVEVSPEQLRPQVYLPERQGSLQIELMAATRRHGRVPYLLPAPDLRGILDEIAAGNPVLILQNNGLSWLPVWHYAVVVGFDLARSEMILRSGAERRLALSFATFQRTWERAGRWALVVTDPDTTPAGAEERSFLDAVATLERVQQFEPALRAYRAAAARWPDSAVAYFGSGNSAAALHRYAEAEQAYRALLEKHPQHAAGWNNLAHVLMEQDRLDAAAQAAERALQLGGATQLTAQATLDEIAARRRYGRAAPPP